MKEEPEYNNQNIYLEGLKKYQERGIPILIDGKQAKSDDWGEIFKVREDGSFYMGDYILEETTQAREGENQRKLKEIRFDKVYYR